MSAETQTIIAVRSALVADTDLITLLGGVKVYDQTAPQNAEMPYVVLGRCALSENDFDQGSAFECVLDIHAWSTQRARIEANNIMERVRDVLHRSNTLTISGYGVSGVQETFSEVMIDPDNITRHGVQSFQIFFEPLGS